MLYCCCEIDCTPRRLSNKHTTAVWQRDSAACGAALTTPSAVVHMATAGRASTSASQQGAGVLVTAPHSRDEQLPASAYRYAAARGAAILEAAAAELVYADLSSEHKEYLSNALLIPAPAASSRDNEVGCFPCLRYGSPLRRIARWLTQPRLLGWETLMLLATLLYAAFLTSSSLFVACDAATGLPPADGTVGDTPGCLAVCASSWSRERVLYGTASLPFAALFTADLLLQALAQGVWGRASYVQLDERLVALARAPCARGARGRCAGVLTSVSLSDSVFARLNFLADAVIVAVGWMEVGLPCTSLASRLAPLRVFRLMRNLARAWRSRGMTEVVNTILSSLVRLCTVFLLLFLGLFSFSVLGVQLWRGLLRGQCGWEDAAAGWQWTDQF